MIHSLITNNALLYLRGHFANSLTSAVELAQRTKSTKHIAFADKLLRIKQAAPDNHLETTTFYKGSMSYRTLSDARIVREDKYRALAQQLSRIKEIKLFLTVGPEEKVKNSFKSVLFAASLRRNLNDHLTAVYAESARLNAVKANIARLGELTAQANNRGAEQDFVQFSQAIHSMINARKNIKKIAEATIDFAGTRLLPNEAKRANITEPARRFNE